MMTLYRVERRWSDMNMNEADIDAASFRAMACLQTFPELRWVRSYYDPATLSSHCYYETEQPDKIREHASISTIPCGEITEVLEITPQMWAGRDLLVLKSQSIGAGAEGDTGRRWWRP
jgi:hypothetical protein